MLYQAHGGDASKANFGCTSKSTADQWHKMAPVVVACIKFQDEIEMR